MVVKPAGYRVMTKHHHPAQAAPWSLNKHAAVPPVHPATTKRHNATAAVASLCQCLCSTTGDPA
jgi:hypothetical protein